MVILRRERTSAAMRMMCTVPVFPRIDFQEYSRPLEPFVERSQVRSKMALATICGSYTNLSTHI